jgi:FkbM family methyltransferase
MLGARVVAVEPQEDCAEYLNTTFGANEHFRLVKQAVGPQEGQAEIYMTSENTISSMSGDWIDAVRKSGRFAQYSWDRKQIVPMTTLDKLIGEYGVPDFIKIDVEGFEYEVLKGLNRSVKAISIEFTPEFLASTLNCIEHLKTIGPIRLNYSVGEGMKLALKRWTTPEELTRILKTTPDDARFFGDVYIRFLDTNDNCSITGVLKNE